MPWRRSTRPRWHGGSIRPTPAARHTPVDIDALPAAFPRLEILHVCGAGHCRVP
jgi:hypothetical protein